MIPQPEIGHPLRSAILASLSERVMSPSLPTSLLTQDKTRARFRIENEYWDYKRSQDFSDKARLAELARDILGLHNAGGGALFIGIDDNWTVIGLPISPPDQCDLRQRLVRYLGPYVEFFCGRIETHRRDADILAVFVPGRKAGDRPVPADSDSPKGGKQAYLRGDFFLRIGDQTKKVVDPIDMQRLAAGFSVSDLEAYACEVDADR